MGKGLQYDISCSILNAANLILIEIGEYHQYIRFISPFFRGLDMSSDLRDDFSQGIKEILAKRVAYLCSNPDCMVQTVGPNSDESKHTNLGVAAHITAAAPGGKRYDPTLTADGRKSPDNGIWLCQTCAKLIDSDEPAYSVFQIKDWKRKSEEDASKNLGQSGGKPAIDVSVQDGGIGRIVSNTGSGTAEEIVHTGKGSAEKIVVKNKGTGEIISNSGSGTAKKIFSTGGSALDVRVFANESVEQASAMDARMIITTCKRCSTNFAAQQVVLGHLGPAVSNPILRCPNCGYMN